MVRITDKILQKVNEQIMDVNHVIGLISRFNEEQPNIKKAFELSVGFGANPITINQIYIGFILAYFSIEETLSENGIDELERMMRI